MLRFSLLGSGSSGNAILVARPGAKILIDSGLTCKQVFLRAEKLGLKLDDLKAVFVTHEHIDHVGGLGVLARKTGATVYITERTHQSLPASVGELPRVAFFEPGETIRVDGLAVSSYSVCHDAADPVCYAVEADGAKLGIASDLGRASTLVRTRLKHSHALLLESNYCPVMLRQGKYPAALQQRIRGDLGHLSNQDMNSLLADLLHDALQLVVLVHLSDENNVPEHAYELAARVLQNHSAKLYIARRHEPTPLFELKT